MNDLHDIAGERFGRLVALHHRLLMHRGRARLQACVDCDGAANEWSYNGARGDAIWGKVNGYTIPYSMNLDTYVPRCHLCHRSRDAVTRRESENA